MHILLGKVWWGCAQLLACREGLQPKTEGGQQCDPADPLLLGAVGTGCPGLQQCCSQLCAQHLTAATVPRAATAVTASCVLGLVVPSDRVMEF